MKENQEYILCAAIHFDDGVSRIHHSRHGTGIVICGYRHHEIFSARPAGFRGKETQGFMTSKGRFVDRKTARIIAERACQIKHEISPQMKFDDLYSENLY